MRVVSVVKKKKETMKKGGSRCRRVRRTKKKTHRVNNKSNIKGRGLVGRAIGTVAGKALVALGAKKLKDLAGYAINRAIDILPGELHLPNYNYCGPGTRLKTRLARGDKGINPLDESCKQHDIAYARSTDNATRSAADKVLIEQAWARVGSSDASIAEKAAALVVTNALKAKRALGGGGGGGRRRRRTRKRRGHGTARPVA